MIDIRLNGFSQNNHISLEFTVQNIYYKTKAIFFLLSFDSIVRSH